MSCAGCEFIGAAPVTLVDGTVVCSSCEAWRQECEARWVLERPAVSDRRRYLEEVEKKRGLEAANALRATILAVWETRKTVANT